MENCKITKMTKITDPEEMADTIRHLNGGYSISADVVKSLGEDFAHSLNRNLMFYGESLPAFTHNNTEIRLGNKDSFGWCPNPASTEYGFTNVDGHIEMETSPLYLSSQWHSKGKEQAYLTEQAMEVASGFKPANTVFLEATSIHERGHETMQELTVAEINRKIDNGELKLPESEDSLGRLVGRESAKLHWQVIDGAMAQLGYDKNAMSPKEYQSAVDREASKISFYASDDNYGKDATGRKNMCEIVSEACRKFAGNREGSDDFTAAIIDQINIIGQRHSMAAAPYETMVKNELPVPKGLIKDGQYNFPDNIKKDADRAKWLDEWRQKNPYLPEAKKTRAKKTAGNPFTMDEYEKANKWDTYFKKEINAYDIDYKSSTPEMLVAKNAEFLENANDEIAKGTVQKIKDAGVEQFNDEIATIFFSKNQEDVGAAVDDFIIKRMNQSANELATNMDGGATPENLQIARATVWDNPVLKSEAVSMLAKLTPESGRADVEARVEALWKEQQAGFHADPIQMDTAKLLGERESLRAQLRQSNRKAKKKGGKIQKELNQSFVGDVTQIVSYKVGGEDVYVVVDDPVVASALKKPNDYKQHGMTVDALARAANYTARMYRLGTTGVNPVSWVTNMLRDPVQAYASGMNPLTMNFSPQAFYHTLRGYGLDDDTIKSVEIKLQNWANSSTLTSQLKSNSGKAYSNPVQKAAIKIDRFGDSKVMNALETPLETWESTFRNKIAQQSFERAYRKSGDVNKSLSRAMFDASNATTNFSHSYAFFRKLQGSVPYAQSAINGTVSFARMFNVNPLGVTMRIVGGFVVPALAITAWNLSDKDRRQAYLNMPEWYRSTHIVLMDLNNDILSIPLPDEVQNFYSTARKLMEYTQEASPYAIPTILAQGAFGFLPMDTDAFFGEDGQFNLGRGVAQMASGLMPQAVTAIYEFITEHDLYTDTDLSYYSGAQRAINAITNVLGTESKQLINDIGTLLNVPEEMQLGLTTGETLARNLFGQGFNDVKSQFYNIIGNPAEINERGKEVKATGLYAERDKLITQLKQLDQEIYFASESEVPALEQKREQMINDFTHRVATLVNKYMNLYTLTGGLEDWQKKKLVQLLELSDGISSGAVGSYQRESMEQAQMDEYGNAVQRYVESGLPAGQSEEGLLAGENSLQLKAALNRFYGAPKQAATDLRSNVENSNIEALRDQYLDAIDQIYDRADEQGIDPDYDMIERIQARYLQALDTVLLPVVQGYGSSILNNNDFINEVRKLVSGMVPSDDWRTSVRNSKKHLSSKDYPLAGVDVKKWIINRYSASMRDRGLPSDEEVVEKMESIRKDIDEGKSGAARGKIQDLIKGVRNADFYISEQDYQLLSQYNSVVK